MLGFPLKVKDIAVLFVGYAHDGHLTSRRHKQLHALNMDIHIFF